MSLREQLRARKALLNRAQTIVTRQDGRRYLEDGGESREILGERRHGYVVDATPDASPAMFAENVFVGSQDCCEPAVLLGNGIGAVLSVGVEAPCRAAGVDYFFVPALDLPGADLKEILAAAVPFIKESVAAGKGGVLIHCNAGVSRSASVAIGYLILGGLDYEAAFRLVKTARPSIRPNEGFVEQLKALARTR